MNDILQKRLEHLKYDKYINEMTVSLLKTDEQKVFQKEKDVLLTEWIAELEKERESNA